MANSDQQQIIVLRDGSGNYYVISGEAIESSRVPEEKKAALEEALQGDVSGFFLPPGFNNVAFQNILTNISAVNAPQTNNATANNVLIGGFVVASPQTVAQIQSNSFAGGRL